MKSKPNKVSNPWKNEISFLDQLVDIVAGAKNSESLLDAGFKHIKNFYNPGALGIFIWAEKDYVIFRQEGLSHILAASMPSGRSTQAGMMPARSDWVKPATAILYLQRMLKTRYPFLRIVDPRCFRQQKGFFICGYDKQVKFPEVTLKIAATLLFNVNYPSSAGVAIQEVESLAFSDPSCVKLIQHIKALSDEFSVPLQIIGNYLYVIDREIPPFDPHKKYLDIIREKLRIIGELTSSLYDCTQKIK